MREEPGEQGERQTSFSLRQEANHESGHQEDNPGTEPPKPQGKRQPATGLNERPGDQKGEKDKDEKNRESGERANS